MVPACRPGRRVQRASKRETRMAAGWARKGQPQPPSSILLPPHPPALWVLGWFPRTSPSLGEGLEG